MGVSIKRLIKDRGVELDCGEGRTTRRVGTGKPFFRKFCLTVVFLLSTVLLRPMPSLAEGVVLIANPDVPVASLTRDEVKRIFLGKKTTWGNGGGKIVFVVQQQADVTGLFLGEYLRQSVYQYTIYWKKRVFSGKGKAPLTFSSDQELAEYVSKTPGAIGYVAAGMAAGNVKTVPVDNGEWTE